MLAVSDCAYDISQFMHACGINDVTDFLAEAIRNPIKADFQSLDDGDPDEVTLTATRRDLLGGGRFDPLESERHF